ncbi:MerR family transcriptional regulator [Streptomyces canus]|uniref:MerR family transcriptional regulator n=1 Tax=Streptomyces canus TaxID=58343 RepID=UPI0036B266C8
MAPKSWEGLLPEGRALNPTAVEYGEEHIQRLRLIRSLVQLGGLSVARTREVLEAVDRPLDREGRTGRR